MDNQTDNNQDLPVIITPSQLKPGVVTPRSLVVPISPQNGDTFYSDGSRFVKVAPGTTGQAWIMNNGVPGWGSGVGATGPTGAKGATGSIGPTGPSTGTTGASGATGPTGPTGSQGATGPIATGVVLQVVTTTFSTEATNATGTLADTGLTATITPSSSSSKILVLFNQGDCRLDTSGGTIEVNLARAGSTIYTPHKFMGNATFITNGIRISCDGTYVDAPATTSATTYKTTFKLSAGTGTAYVQADNSTASMILMEIAG